MKARGYRHVRHIAHAEDHQCQSEVVCTEAFARVLDWVSKGYMGLGVWHFWHRMFHPKGAQTFRSINDNQMSIQKQPNARKSEVRRSNCRGYRA